MRLSLWAPWNVGIPEPWNSPATGFAWHHRSLIWPTLLAGSSFATCFPSPLLYSQPGRGSSWQSDSESWWSWGSKRWVLTKNFVFQGSLTWYNVELPTKMVYWLIFLKFLLCKLSNIYKNRKENTTNPQVPITWLQLLSTYGQSCFFYTLPTPCTCFIILK